MKNLLHEWYLKSEQVSPVRLARFDRKKLIQHMATRGMLKGAEIGVDGGRFSEYMCKNIPNLELYCVDPWVTSDSNRSGYHKKYEQTKQLLAPYNCHIIRDFSLNAVKEIEDHSLDFIYIDGDHTFDFVMTDLIEWAKKVRYGGLIAGHDYYRFRRAGVVPAVDAYTQQHRVDEWFLTDEKAASWFWIKEEKHDI